MLICEGIQEIINQKSILVFDFDGVLADSVDIKADAFAELYSLMVRKLLSKWWHTIWLMVV